MAKKSLTPELVLRLRRAIQSSEQSLNKLSQVCEVDRGRLSRFLRDERDLTLTAAGKLCEALGLDLVQNGWDGESRRKGLGSK